MNKQLDDLLKYDPLDMAEKVTGKDLANDEGTMAVGLLLMQENSNKKNALLEANDDTQLSNTLENYVRVIESMGFEKAVEVSFEGHVWREGDKAPNEKLFIYGHREKGIILKFDTYGGTNVNGGKYYYCWKPLDVTDKRKFRVTSSGRWNNYGKPDEYWQGDHDAREAVRHNINMIEEVGQFITPWPSKQFVWFLHYMDTKEKDYNREAINAERIALTPEWMKDIMNEH